MTLYPNGAAIILADVIRTELALAVLKLYQTVTPPLSVSTELADLVEADFTGYTAKTITAWLPIYLDPAGGASFQSGTKQFDISGPVTVSNVINGFWVENADGDLICAGSFDSPIAMANVGDSIPVNVVLNWCAPPT